MQDTALIIFYKNFVLGNVKTRIAQSTGAKKALDIYKELCSICIVATSAFQVDKYVFYSDEILRSDIWDDKIYVKELQEQSADLGVRMSAAFHDLSKSYRKVLIMGTDCPYIDLHILESAQTALQEHDLVIGPSLDGGYYLLGLRTYQPELFKNIRWSSAHVMNETLAIAEKLSLTYHLLPSLQDIDYEEDWNTYLKSTM